MNEFVLSNWKYLIDHKWRIIIIRLVIPTLMNWLHGLFFNLALLFPNVLALFVMDFIAIALIFSYESISIISSGFLKYISQFNNIFDVIMIFLCIATNILTYINEGLNETSDLVWLEILQIICLFVIYYRCISFLRIFKTFRNVIDMLLSVTFSALSLIIIIGFFIVGISVMMSKADKENASFPDFLKYNVFLVQGSLNFEKDNFNSLQWILYVVDCVLLPIILVNFLIAKMSNKYEELEKIEEVTSYKEKASLIAEIEYFYLINQMRKIKSHKINREKKQLGFTFLARNTTKDKNVIDEEDDDENNLTHSLDSFQEQIQNLNSQFKLDL